MIFEVFKTQNQGDFKIMKLWLIMLIVLVIMGFIVASTFNLDMTNKDDQKTFAKAYTGFMIKVAKNVKELAGKAISQDWSANQTNNTKE